jgi:hypothetical protein
VASLRSKIKKLEASVKRSTASLIAKIRHDPTSPTMSSIVEMACVPLGYFTPTGNVHKVQKSVALTVLKEEMRGPFGVCSVNKSNALTGMNALLPRVLITESSIDMFALHIGDSISSQNCIDKYAENYVVHLLKYVGEHSSAEVLIVTFDDRSHVSSTKQFTALQRQKEQKSQASKLFSTSVQLSDDCLLEFRQGKGNCKGKLVNSKASYYMLASKHHFRMWMAVETAIRLQRKVNSSDKVYPVIIFTGFSLLSEDGAVETRHHGVVSKGYEEPYYIPDICEVGEGELLCLKYAFNPDQINNILDSVPNMQLRLDSSQPLQPWIRSKDSDAVHGALLGLCVLKRANDHRINNIGKQADDWLYILSYNLPS